MQYYSKNNYGLSNIIPNPVNHQKKQKKKTLNNIKKNKLTTKIIQTKTKLDQTTREQIISQKANSKRKIKIIIQICNSFNLLHKNNP